MILSLFDKISGFLDRRFLAVYWAPVAIGAAVPGLAWVFHDGLPKVVAAWEDLGAARQAVLVGVILLVITLLANLLQAFSVPIVQWYEGYLLPGWLARWSHAGQKLAWQRWKSLPSDSLEARLAYNQYPFSDEHLAPTRLGNVFASAEEHPFRMLNIDSVLWWPRLFPLLPAEMKAQLDAVLLPVFGLLNLATLLGLGALGASIYLLAVDLRWWLFGAFFLGGPLLVRGCYEAAISQAVSYGDLVRSAFDLHRRKILIEMGIAAPDNLDDELILWEVLNKWIDVSKIPPYQWLARYRKNAAWKVRPWLAAPFFYNLKVPPASPSGPVDEDVVLSGSLIIHLPGRGKKHG